MIENICSNKFYWEWFNSINNKIDKLISKGWYPNKLKWPLGVQLEITDSCNLRCLHCYNRSGEKHIGNSELTAEEWRQTLIHLKSIKPLICIISGGEPLLRLDITMLALDTLSIQGTKFILISNGFLLSEELIKQISKFDFYWIQISIDGATAETHDKLRAKAGSWERALKSAFLIKQAGLPLVIATTLSEHNLTELDDIIDLAYLLGAHRIVLDEFTPIGRGYSNFDQLKIQTNGELWHTRLKNKLEEYTGRMEVARGMPPEISLRYDSCMPCSAFIIRPNGDVRLDCIAPFVIGNVRKEPISEIWKKRGRDAWKHPRVQEFVKSIKTPESFLESLPRPFSDEDILILD